MEKEMYPLSVSTTQSGDICISNNCSLNEQSILFSPDQADTVIKWIQEAKDELNKL